MIIVVGIPVWVGGMVVMYDMSYSVPFGVRVPKAMSMSYHVVDVVVAKVDVLKVKVAIAVVNGDAVGLLPVLLNPGRSLRKVGCHRHDSDTLV